MKIVQMHSLILNGDAVSNIMLANHKIDQGLGWGSSLVSDLFSEIPDACVLAFRDYEKLDWVYFLSKFLKVEDKAHYVKEYIKALMIYRRGKARDAIENADVRIWHFGAFYVLLKQFHRRDILWYQGITYPYLSSFSQFAFQSYNMLQPIKSLDPTIIVASRFMKRDLERQGFRSEDIKVLPLMQKYKLPYAPRNRGGRKRLLAYGRYSRNKAVPELTRYCQEAGIDLTYFGDNKSMGEFRKEYSKAEKYADHAVRLLPKQLDIEPFFEESDIYICNSYHEGFNMPAIEAMAHSMPVLLRSGTGMDELIKNGVEGYTYGELDEIPDLVGKIRKNYKRFSYNSWKRSQNYGMDRYRENYLRVLKEHKAAA